MPLKRDKPVALEHPPAISAETYIRTAMEEQVNLLVLRIQTIDALILQADWLLERRQPFQSGRMRVKFEEIDGQFRPQVLVWQRMRLTREWRYVRVKPVGLTRRMKRARLFKDNFRLNVELIEMVQILIEKRRAILNSVTEFNHASNLRLQSIGGLAEKLQPRLMDLMRDKDNPNLQWFDPEDPIDWTIDHEDS